MGEGEKVSDLQFPHFVAPPPPPHPVIIDQPFILVNFEGPFLLSPSEITRELFELLTSISQGIHRYKVPVVGKNGELWSRIGPKHSQPIVKGDKKGQRSEKQNPSGSLERAQ